MAGSFSCDETTTSSDNNSRVKRSSARALTMADIERLNEQFSDSSEEMNEERIAKWVKECTDIYNCCAELPYQQKETVSFSKFKPKPPNTPRHRKSAQTASLHRSKTTL